MLLSDKKGWVDMSGDARSGYQTRNRRNVPLTLYRIKGFEDLVRGKDLGAIRSKITSETEGGIEHELGNQYSRL